MAKTASQLAGRLWDGAPGPWWLSLLRGAARPASWLYGAGAGMYHWAWNRGWGRVRRLPMPVIGVGNLVAGGAGKTPLVAALVQELKALGLPTAVISRGYGGQARGVTWVSQGSGHLADPRLVGDEPVMLAKQLAVPVVVGADRFAAGLEAISRLGPVVLVADDLFQHRGLHRDLNLLTMDADRPLGNGQLLPRGPLREPVTGLRRADAVVLTRAEDSQALARTRQWLGSYLGLRPVLACRHVLRGLSLPSGQALKPEEWAGKRVVSFCGLARPGDFERSLAAMGLDLVHQARFVDHHFFSGRDLVHLWEQARRLGAQALVCSQKDAARLGPKELEDLPPDAVIWVSRLDLEFEQEEDELRRLIKSSLRDWGNRK